jgi:hypothetical protein
VDSSKRIWQMTILAVIAGWLVTQALSRALATPSTNKLVLTGTVTAISPVRTRAPSRRNWTVTVRVERVKTGKYSQPEFTFNIHSPARAGLAVGRRCTIEATLTGQEYIVDETRPIKGEGTGR